MLPFKKQSLRSLAAMLGSQFGVDISIQGESAYTDFLADPPKINIPDINLLDPNADNVLVTTLVRGFLDHEAGHVRFTDRETIRNFNDITHKQRGFNALFDDAFIHNVWNIYEDVFIERKMGQYYKGCAVNLRNIGNHIFVDKAPDSLAQQTYAPFKNDKEYSMASALTYALMQITLYSARGQANPDIKDVLDRWMAEIQGIHQKKPGQPVPEALCRFHDELQPIAMQSLTIKSSAESLDLALQTIALMNEKTKDILKDYQQKQQQAQQALDNLMSQQSGDGSQGQDQQDQQDQPSDGDTNQQVNQTRRYKEACDTAVRALKKLADALDARASSATGDKDHPCDVSKLSRNIDSITEGANEDELARQAKRGQQSAETTDLTERASQDLSELVQQQQTDHSFSKTQTFDCTMRGYKDRLIDGDPAMSDVRISEVAVAMGNTLGRRIHSVLQTNTLVRHGTASRGTRIDTRKLWRLGTHNPRVFRHDTDGRAVDTEVIMVVDCSGSMDGNCHVSAMGSALGMLIATQSITACNIGIVAHTSETIYIMKHPRQYMRPQDVKLVPATGGTFIGGAYRTAMEEFTGEARRNVIILLSDGCSSDMSDEKVLTEAIEEANELGIATLGVGLGDKNLMRYLPEDKFSYASSHRDVPGILFGLLRKVMA